MAQQPVQGVIVGASTEPSHAAPSAEHMRKSDLEEGTRMSDAMPPEIRNGFIKKVYTLLTLMLVVTTVVAFPFQLLSVEQVRQNFALLQVLMFSSLVITLSMTCCCLSMMRRYPTNYVFLFIFSVLYGIIVGSVAMCYTLPSVLLAAGITGAIFLLLTAYACFTKTDFTGMGPYLMVALFGLIVFGFVGGIIAIFCASCNMWINLIYASLGAVLFSFYIVYDTQLIVGGRHKKHEYSIDDYAFAALSLYMDVINLFLMILSLFGSRK